MLAPSLQEKLLFFGGQLLDLLPNCLGHGGLIGPEAARGTKRKTALIALALGSALTAHGDWPPVEQAIVIKGQVGATATNYVIIYCPFSVGGDISSCVFVTNGVTVQLGICDLATNVNPADWPSGKIVTLIGFNPTLLGFTNSMKRMQHELSYRLFRSPGPEDAPLIAAVKSFGQVELAPLTDLLPTSDAGLVEQDSKPAKFIPPVNAPKVITFTNKDGVAIYGAEVLSFNAVDVFYKTPGGGSRVHLADLPQGLQQQFGYDPATFEAAMKAAERHRRALAEQEAQAAQAASYAAMQRSDRARVERTKMFVEGRVIQKLREGLLINSASERSRIGSIGGEVQGWVVDGVHLYVGTCLLTGSGAPAVDGEVVKFFCYPDGTFTYTAVSGGEKTIRRFTVQPSDVMQPATDDEMKILTQLRPY